MGWCVYEAHCAVSLKIPVEIAGDANALITDRASMEAAKKTVEWRQLYRCLLIVAFVVLFLIAPICLVIFIPILLWQGKKQRLQLQQEREAKLRAIDVRSAKCSVLADQV